MNSGANPNAADTNGITALHYAMRKGFAGFDGVEYTPSLPPPPNMPELVKALLTHGADPNARIAKDYPEFSRTAVNFHTSLIGMTPYLLAAAAADPGLMQLLADHGADPSLMAKGNVTALMLAAGAARIQDRTGRDATDALEAVQVAVQLGADVNVVDGRGRTALHAAAAMGADDIVQFLASKGANVNAKDKGGNTPWSTAAALIPVLNAQGGLRFHKSTADLLLKLGAKEITLKDFPAAASAYGNPPAEADKQKAPPPAAPQ